MVSKLISKMAFKRWSQLFSIGVSSVLVASLMVSALTLTACDRFLKSDKTAEQKAAQDVMQIQSQQLACIALWPDQLKRYFGDELEEVEINSMFSCLQKSLGLFARLTRGDRKDSYSSEDLRYFLNRYLLSSNQINPDFMSEMMKLKVLAVGGDGARLSRTEISLVQSFLGDIREQAVNLRGLWKLMFFGRSDQNIVQSDLDRAKKSAKDSLSALLEKTQITRSQYAWSDLRNFEKELSQFIGDNKVFALLNKWLPILEAGKEGFIGQDVKLVVLKDWTDHIEWALDCHFAALRYFYDVKPKDLNSVAGWRSLISLADEVINLVSVSPQMKKANFVPAYAIDRMIDESAKIFPISALSSDVLKNTYRRALVNFFGSTTPSTIVPQSLEFRGFESKHLAALKLEYNVWKSSQIFILSLFENTSTKVPMQFKDVKKKVSDFKFDIVNLGLQNVASQKKALSLAWQEWVEILTQDPPFAFDDDLHLLMNGKEGDQLQTTLAGLSTLNGLRIFARLVVQGYGDRTDENSWRTYISESRLVSLESDFRAFGRALGFLDPRTPNPAVRTFLETNLFTWHGNGDVGLSGNEFLDELGMMISGGKVIPDQAWKLLDKQGDLVDEKDWLQRPLAKCSAMKELFQNKSERFLQGLPLFRKFISELKPEEFEAFYASLAAVGRLPGASEQLCEKIEFRNMVMVLHYLESLMTVYDVDHDGHLNKEELLLAFPRFKNFIVSASPVGSFMASDVFLYLAINGEKPTWKDLIKFQGSKAMGIDPIDRGQLLKVLAVMKRAQAAAAAAAAKN